MIGKEKPGPPGVVQIYSMWDFSREKTRPPANRTIQNRLAQTESKCNGSGMIATLLNDESLRALQPKTCHPPAPLHLCTSAPLHLQGFNQPWNAVGSVGTRTVRPAAVTVGHCPTSKIATALITILLSKQGQWQPKAPLDSR